MKNDRNMTIKAKESLFFISMYQKRIIRGAQGGLKHFLLKLYLNFLEV